MIKIEYVDTYGWEAAIRGMRNPRNSWNKSDSAWLVDPAPDMIPDIIVVESDGIAKYVIGQNDQKLMTSLSYKGSVHGKFKRMIIVTCDIIAPLYWWKEFDTYKVGTVANSCSTMHKIHEKGFTPDDFSHEHLKDLTDCMIKKNPEDLKPIGTIMYNDGCMSPIGGLHAVIDILNCYRELYLETGDKECWWQMIQLLPSSYNQKRTVQINYEVLSNIYMNRKDHKLDEWREFCKFMKENLPFPELFTGEGLCVCEE